MNIGKYNNKCNVNEVRKGGFEYIKYKDEISHKLKKTYINMYE